MVVAASVAGLMLATLSVLRYTAYNAGMLDLGNMSQAIWSATQGRPLEFTYVSGNFSRLGFHVELIYFLLAPLYALWPSPVMLLIFQAVFFVLGAFPLYQLASRKLKQRYAARALALIYLMYPVAQTAVLFDFHGDTLTMPLVLFAIDALDRRAWRTYGLWLCLALSCKIYVAAPVTALGVTLWLTGRRKAGLATTSLGLIWGSGGFFIVRPLFAPSVANEFTTTLASYMEVYFGTMGQDILTTALPRLLIAGIIFAPLCLPSMFALQWSLPVLAIALPALLSTGLGPSYHYKHHHYAIFVPFALVNIVYGIQALHQNTGFFVKLLRRWGFIPWRFSLNVALMLTLILNVLLVNTPFNPQFWRGNLGQGFDELSYQRTSRDALKDRWLRNYVPASVPLAVSPYLAPHVINRATLYRSRDVPACLDTIDYAVLDALFDFVVPLSNERFDGGPGYEANVIRRLLQQPNFSLIEAQDGLLLFQRDAPAQRTLIQTVDVHENLSTDNVLAQFGEQIALTEMRIEALEARHFRLRYTWLALAPLPPEAAYFAISRLASTSNARIVHLPTYALYPTTQWNIGETIQETFDIRIPDEIPAGPYPLWVGWYDSAHLTAFATDAHSRVGNEIQVGLLTLPETETK